MSVWCVNDERARQSALASTAARWNRHFHCTVNICWIEGAWGASTLKRVGDDPSAHIRRSVQFRFRPLPLPLPLPRKNQKKPAWNKSSKLRIGGVKVTEATPPKLTQANRFHPLFKLDSIQQKPCFTCPLIIAMRCDSMRRFRANPVPVIHPSLWYETVLMVESIVSLSGRRRREMAAPRNGKVTPAHLHTTLHR